MLHDNNNILLITDYEEIAKLVLEKLILLRDNDRITACNSQKIKKLWRIRYVVLLFCMKTPKIRM